MDRLVAGLLRARLRATALLRLAVCFGFLGRRPERLVGIVLQLRLWGVLAAASVGSHRLVEPRPLGRVGLRLSSLVRLSSVRRAGPPPPSRARGAPFAVVRSPLQGRPAGLRDGQRPRAARLQGGAQGCRKRRASARDGPPARSERRVHQESQAEKPPRRTASASGPRPAVAASTADSPGRPASRADSAHWADSAGCRDETDCATATGSADETDRGKTAGSADGTTRPDTADRRGGRQANGDVSSGAGAAAPAPGSSRASQADASDGPAGPRQAARAEGPSRSSSATAEGQADAQARSSPRRLTAAGRPAPTAPALPRLDGAYYDLGGAYDTATGTGSPSLIRAASGLRPTQ